MDRLRTATEDELRSVLEHVAGAGFDPGAREPVRGGMVGHRWRGLVLQPGAWISTADRHFLTHVEISREWPPGTTFEEWLDDIRRHILDPQSDVLVSRFQRASHAAGGSAQLAVIWQSDVVTEQVGSRWCMVEYRVETGHWMTAFRLRLGRTPSDHFFGDPRRTSQQWLRGPS